MRDYFQLNRFNADIVKFFLMTLLLIFMITQASMLAAESLKPGAVFSDPLADGGMGPKLVVVPGGRFILGANGRNPNEQPKETEIKGPFAVGQFEVTESEYEAFQAASGYERDYQEERESWGWSSQKPMNHVTWKDAMAYLNWLSEQTGEVYRLPTEAEWEYVARAGTTTTYWWGDRTKAEMAHCAECDTPYLFRDQTLNVGQFQPNPFGLYDTAGNLWEWTASPYEDQFDGKEHEIFDGSDEGLPLSVRGGSFDSDISYIRSGFRDSRTADFQSYAIGFRVLREIK